MTTAPGTKTDSFVALNLLANAAANSPFKPDHGKTPNPHQQQPHGIFFVSKFRNPLPSSPLRHEDKSWQAPPPSSTTHLPQPANITLQQPSLTAAPPPAPPPTPSLFLPLLQQRDMDQVTQQTIMALKQGLTRDLLTLSAFLAQKCEDYPEIPIVSTHIMRDLACDLQTVAEYCWKNPEHAKDVCTYISSDQEPQIPANVTGIELTTLRQALSYRIRNANKKAQTSKKTKPSAATSSSSSNKKRQKLGD